MLYIKVYCFYGKWFNHPQLVSGNSLDNIVLNIHPGFECGKRQKAGLMVQSGKKPFVVTDEISVLSTCSCTLVIHYCPNPRLQKQIGMNLLMLSGKRPALKDI